MRGQAAREIAIRIAVYTVLEHSARPRKIGNFPGSGEALEEISEAANALAQDWWFMVTACSSSRKEVITATEGAGAGAAIGAAPAVLVGY
jgi:hypothetical protein